MSKKVLIHRNRVPYGGMYDIKRPDLGLVGAGITFDKLESCVRMWRRVNGLPNGLGLTEELMAVVCEEYPQECKDGNPEMNPPGRLYLADVILGTKVMARVILSKLFGGNPIVSDQEAARRSAICANCKFNVQFSKPCGGGCGELKAIVAALVGSKKVDGREKLWACAHCKCYLESAVWVRLDLQTKDLDENIKARFEATPNCWKKPSLVESK